MSVNSSFSLMYDCTEFRAGLFISIAFCTTKAVLLLPLSIFVVFLGHQRWRWQRCFETTSHADIFTYHMAFIELIHAIGLATYIGGICTNRLEVLRVGMVVCSMVFGGQMCFHILTCVERYLAVVHPVVYMGLKNSRGVKIRNISIGCVWLLTFGWAGLAYGSSFSYVPLFCLLVFCLIVVSFCSLSVLCVLIRPGPGEVGGDRERVDQSKQRAFHSVMAIMAVLCLWFAGVLLCLSLENSHMLSYSAGCVLLISSNWFSLPSSLVLPLLFLHRAGKLLCVK